MKMKSCVGIQYILLLIRTHPDANVGDDAHIVPQPYGTNLVR